MPKPSYKLWIVAYAEPADPVPANLVVRLHEEMEQAFRLSKRTIVAGHNGRRVRSVGDVRNWIATNFRPNEIARDREIGGAVSIASQQTTDDSMGWYIASQWGPVHHQRCGPHLCAELLIGVDLSTEMEAGSAYLFSCRAAEILINDATVWYGHFDAASTANIPNRAAYTTGTWIDFARWEQLAEHSYWNHFALGARDRVRGVFWGNILGPEFSRRVREAGIDEIVEWMQDCEGPEYSPVTIYNQTTGAMALLLDDDPVAFAQTRDTGMMDLGGMNRAVKTGAVLREAFSRAALL